MASQLESEYEIEFKLKEWQSGPHYEAHPECEFIDGAKKLMTCTVALHDGIDWLGKAYTGIAFDFGNYCGFNFGLDSIETVRKYFAKYKIPKKKGYEQLTLF